MFKKANQGWFEFAKTIVAFNAIKTWNVYKL
jgi:hypothetical protein